MADLKLTLEEGRQALGVHVLTRGTRLRQKYGNFIDERTLNTILKDPEFVRFPVRIEFDSKELEPGMFGTARRIEGDADKGYVIKIHEYFHKRTGDWPALVFYHLATVNYGDFASCNEAEVFGSAALGMEQEEYYQLLCRLTDSIPS